MVSANAQGTSLTFDSQGKASGTAGALVAQFSYDGLGRLTRKLSPFPSTSDYRTEHYYYDGVRRIQEVWSDPISAYSPFSSEDEDGATPTTWAEREYVYTPNYVDEFICQFDGWDRLAYVLQDANYNVLALVDDNGNVIEQYTWSPYGVLLATEQYGTFSPSKIGHQGLFFDRFDAAITQPPLVSGAFGLFENRNRSYSPTLGRFMQDDPNGSGQVFMNSLARLGEALNSEISTVHLDLMYPDGLNAHLYLRANPFSAQDPTGRFSISIMIITVFLGVTIGGGVGTVAGGLGSLAGGGSFWTGAANGFVGGVFGGAAGGVAGGLGFGLMGSGMFAGGVGGGVGSLANGNRELGALAQDVAFGVFTGIATAGLGRGLVGKYNLDSDSIRELAVSFFSSVASGFGVGYNEFIDAFYESLGWR
jgi:hypothetical protein